MFDEKGNEVRPLRATTARTYIRPKGDKVLSDLPIASGEGLQLDPSAVLKEYDTIFCLDSNTRTIDGTRVTASAVILGKWKNRSQAEAILQFAPLCVLEFREVDCQPDLLALQQLMVQHAAHPQAATSGRLCIIIDSNLGDLPRIRQRVLPILDDCFLPEAVDIAYAGDGASDSLANILLKAADRCATDFLAAWEKLCIPESQAPIPAHASYFRVWTPRTNA